MLHSKCPIPPPPPILFSIYHNVMKEMAHVWYNNLLHFDMKIFGLKEYTKKNVSEKEEMPKLVLLSVTLFL